jgi:hypothetical protein
VTVIAHHAGEQVILGAALASGLLSGSLLVMRARLAELARRWRGRGLD